MTEVRVAVERENDAALYCPRCVALDGLDDAPDLASTVGEHELPTDVIRKPRPAADTVRTLGCYCEKHDVLLPTTYGDATDRDDLLDREEWIAAPIQTEVDQPLAVPVPLTEMVGKS